VNTAHPFREGNGRAAKLFLQQISKQSPWRMDYDQVDATRWNQTSEQSRPRDPRIMPPDPAALVAVFEAATVPRTEQGPANVDAEAAAALRAARKGFGTPAFTQPARGRQSSPTRIGRGSTSNAPETAVTRDRATLMSAGNMIGYARVSTIEQNPALQHDALNAAGR